MSSLPTAAGDLVAGAATGDITPPESMFLFGYPHVPRMSTGVHDPLECAALYLKSDGKHALFLAHDIICITRGQTAGIRARIAAQTGVPVEAIMITATHTHSGPMTGTYLSNGADPVVPPLDLEYIALFIERVVATAVRAIRSAVPAEMAQVLADATGIGTNRHVPTGPADLQVPVLVVRAAGTLAPIGAMLVCAMHPTVLHEDTTLVSSDFPFFARQYVQKHVLGTAAPVLFHQGASGNQSPRHVTRGNTFPEAQRIGEILGQAVAVACQKLEYKSRGALRVRRAAVEAPTRNFPPPTEAKQRVTVARERFARLQAEGAPRPAVRTAECDVFGAEETAELATAAVDGRLATAIAACLPAEIQAITVGVWTFVAWPGEFFVEYALEIRRRAPGTFVVTLANGELQGYVATEEAEQRGYYEANNAVFAPATGRMFVDATLALLDQRS